MIARAKPYVNKRILKEIIKNKNIENYEENGYYYFNSGRGAIKWFLETTVSQNKKVAVQSFTCEVVKQVILESGNKIVYLDTDNIYYTTLLKDLIGHEDIDILILTHLFGIPNPDYLLIKQWAEKNKIVILDDLSQTVFSKVGGTYLEEISDNYIYSFSYDKPISCNGGGLLKIKDKEKYYNNYMNLGEESSIKAYFDLKKLYIFDELINENNYLNDFRAESLIEKILILFYPLNKNTILKKLFLKVIYSRTYLLINKVELKLTSLIIKRDKEIKVLKISKNKKEYLNMIMEENKEYNFLYLEILNKLNLFLKDMNVNEILSDSRISISPGLRFSFQVENRDERIKELSKLGIEATASNWNKLICNESDHKMGKKIVNRIINIPIWSEKILELIRYE